MLTPIEASIGPVIGTRRLCKKLPRIISIDAQRLPMIAAFNHIGLTVLLVEFKSINSKVIYFG
jgi:hypothetical protein